MKHRRKLRHLGFRLALFWGAVGGAYAALPSLSDYIGPLTLTALCVVLGAALAWAHFTKQPGAE